MVTRRGGRYNVSLLSVGWSDAAEAESTQPG